MKRWIHASADTRYSTEDISDSIWAFAPALAEDMIFDEWLKPEMNEKEFINFLHQKAKSPELEFDSNEEVEEWIDEVLNNSIFR